MEVLTMATETAIQDRSQNEVTRREHARNGVHFSPSLDILENEQELMVMVEMPGVGLDDLDINVEKGALSIHGKAMPRQKDGVRYLLNEYGVGDFRQTFEVSESIDSDQITAETENGVLILHLPKIEAARPRKIAVTTK
jgi:HSP20 family molecular chaperone IbpA